MDFVSYIRYIISYQSILLKIYELLGSVIFWITSQLGFFSSSGLVCEVTEGDKRRTRRQMKRRFVLFLSN
jgi:hypothetical protein